MGNNVFKADILQIYKYYDSRINGNNFTHIGQIMQNLTGTHSCKSGCIIGSQIIVI